MAFNEAIEKFDVNKSKSFLKFAEMVIKKRMIDYLEKHPQSAEKKSLFPILTAITKLNLEKK